MMTLELEPQDPGLLVDLLRDPRESLDVEIKGWFDLIGNEEHKATLAKAVLALANHGGGYLIIGFVEANADATPAPTRPPALDGYSQDVVNGIIHNYAEPPFHCSVHLVAHQTSGLHPVIVVPGGHRVPIRARRGGPNGQIVQQHFVYVRRPGPRSEQPQTGREWDELFGRCLAARRDELLDRIRDLLAGRPSEVSPGHSTVVQTSEARLDSWVSDCEQRWRKRIGTLPDDSASRFPFGYYAFAYSLENPTQLPLSDLLAVLRDAPKLTGWNVWWVPTRPEIAPYSSDGAIECWIGGDTDPNRQETRDAPHADFWRVSPVGLAFLLRGYQEDGHHAAGDGIKPGTVLDATLPIWRVGEGLLHAAYLSSRLNASAVSFAAHYTGLKGRRLTHWNRIDHIDWAGGISRDDDIRLATQAPAESIEASLTEIVTTVLLPFYEQFDFTRLPSEVVKDELNRLRKRTV
jgi:hypothetical protein